MSAQPEPMTRRSFATRIAVPLVASLLPGCSSHQPERVSVPADPPSFDEAKSALQAIIRQDSTNPAIRIEGIPRLYVHDKPVEHALVLFHGFTNSPQQFDELARACYRQGCNVYVPRLPRHGLRDRLTHDLTNLTVTEIKNSADESFSLARGLGRRVAVLGLSLGGLMAMWLTQTQPVDLSVPVAPFLMPLAFPETQVRNAARLAVVLPSFYFWWDSKLKDKSLPDYAYPGYPSRSMAQLVFLGNEIFALAATNKPQAKRCILVTNIGENAVDNNVSRRLLALWNSQGAGYKELVLQHLGPPRHDIIDPVTFPEGRTLVYPTLERLILS
jgi:alpha-beta hydrolase superfamily lysophospholipase